MAGRRHWRETQDKGLRLAEVKILSDYGGNTGFVFRNYLCQMWGLKFMMPNHGASNQQPGDAHPRMIGSPSEKFVPSSGELSTRDLLYPVFRYKWMILFLFSLSTAGALFYVVNAPETFTSEARLMISDNRQDLVINPMADSGSYLKNAPRLNIDYVRAEIGIIQSIALAEKVVDRVGPPKILGPTFDARIKQKGLEQQAAQRYARNEAVKSLRRNLDVQPNMSGSNILLVSYKSYSPGAAQDILATLIDAYIQYNVDSHRARIAPGFFDAKAKDLEKRMKDQESELAAVRKRLNITSIQNGIKQLSEQLSALEASNKESLVLIDSLRAKITTYDTLIRSWSKKGSASGSVAALGTSPLLEDLKKRLVELQMQEAVLSETYNPKAPVLQELRKQIDYLQKQITSAKKNQSDQPLSLVSPGDPTQPNIMVQMQMAKADLEGQIAAQKSRDVEIAKTRQDLATLLSLQSEVAGLEREVELSENEYKLSRNSKQIAEISKMMDEDRMSNISIVQGAALSPESSRSTRKLAALLIFGSLSGLGLGLALAVGRDFLKSTIRRPEDVELKLGIPVLVSLPRTGLVSTRGPNSAEVGESGIILNPCDGIKRQMELLKLRVLTMAQRRYGDKPISIMFTSCHPGSGVSTIATNFAMSLSQDNESNVLMVDCNLKKQGFSRVLTPQKHPRKTERGGGNGEEVLAVGDRRIAKVHSNLDMIVNLAKGDAHEPPIPMGEHNRFLQAAKMRYNYVVIDSPALSEANYSNMLAANVDVLVMVVEVERVRRHALKHVIEQMEDLDINLCGVVLNKRRYPIPNFIYKML